jgi:hypothetical protein
MLSVSKANNRSQEDLRLQLADIVAGEVRDFCLHQAPNVYRSGHAESDYA